MQSMYSCNYNASYSSPAISTEFEGEGNRTSITVTCGDEKSKFYNFDVKHNEIKIGVSSEVLDYSEKESV